MEIANEAKGQICPGKPDLTDQVADNLGFGLVRLLQERWSRKLYALVIALLIIMGWALFCWGYQIKKGLGVAGITRPIFWGVYIVNFVFWIGISHAGTLISAILRVTKASWRYPITRCAEAITVFALMIGPMFIIIHLGRPWYFYWVIPYPNERGLWPNFRSPLLWDFSCINTYLLGSLTYLYLPMIPDLALLRDNFKKGWRRRLYALFSLGWQGTERQWGALERAISVMAIIIMPLAVSVHTVVSWVFGMTLNPMWKSTIFGPYFVVGAIYSGIAATILAMGIIRRAFRLEEHIRPIHFNNLGLLLLTFSILWLYFTFAEYLTVWYGNEPWEIASMWYKMQGKLSPLFWGMVASCFLIPLPILALRRTVRGTMTAACFVLVGMWLERYTIVIGTLSRPRLSFNWASYTPTWVEVSITAGAFAYFIFLYVVFSKLFPIISIWELKMGLGELHVVKRPARSLIPLFAVLGGIVGAGGGFLLSALTSKAIQLPTGGMPIVALPPSAIIAFAFGALGAILGALLSTLVEGKLPSLRHPS